MEYRVGKNCCLKASEKALGKSSIFICHEKWVGFQQVDMEIKIFKKKTFNFFQVVSLKEGNVDTMRNCGFRSYTEFLVMTPC